MNYGIHVTEFPALSMPSERVTYTNVPGRPGSLTTIEGDDVYEDQVLSVTCFITDTSQIANISRYLKGSGTVTFANRQGGFYYARIVNQISFEKILRGNPACTFTVNFRCKPFWYMSGVQDITLTATGQSVTNPGSVYSEPVITINGSGDITLMVDQTIVELTGITSSITLNSAIMEAYNGTTSMNSAVSGDFIHLKPGLNGVSWVGNVSSVVIKPNWRFLV